MSRKRTAEATGEPETIGSSVDQIIDHAKATLGAQVVNEPSPFPPEQLAPQDGNGQETAAPQKKPFQVVRGWTSRNKAPVQYRKLTDADLNVVLFKFVLPKDANDKDVMPTDIKDILDAHKRYPETGEATGLHFENSAKHGKVWVIKNNAEGRAIADKVDYALQKLAAKHDLQTEQAASR